MKFLNGLKIVTDAPVDDVLKNKNWGVDIKGSSMKYRINSNGELESFSLSVKENINSEEDINEEYLESDWFKMENFTGHITAKDGENKAEFIILNGNVKNVNYKNS